MARRSSGKYFPLDALGRVRGGSCLVRILTKQSLSLRRVRDVELSRRGNISTSVALRRVRDVALVLSRKPGAVNPRGRDVAQNNTTYYVGFLALGRGTGTGISASPTPSALQMPKLGRMTVSRKFGLRPPSPQI